MNLLTVLLVTITVGEVLTSKFHGPTALPVVLHSGYLADTHEVAAAKRVHLATLSHQAHEVSYEHRGDSNHHEHSTLPHAYHNGYIADTSDVAAAKAEHFAAVAKARKHGGYQHVDSHSDAEYDHNSAASGYGYGNHYSYHGPTAKPKVLHNGYIADTPDVAAAKAEHFAAVAKAHTHGGSQHVDSYSGAGYDHNSRASGYGYETHSSYHGPTAKPKVLHNGYIADTPEVAAVKAEHFAAVAEARKHGEHHHKAQDASGYNRHAEASEAYHEHSSQASYHGPTAKPVVLPSGYLADTNEVSHAKHRHIHLLHSSQSALHKVY